MLRNRIPFNPPDGRGASYPDPDLGVDLRSADDNVGPRFAAKMQNYIMDGKPRKRNGGLRLSSTQYAANKKGVGGIKFYYSSSSKVRVIAYGSTVSQIADDGTETTITTSQTADSDTHFQPWSISDALYWTNSVDPVGKLDNTLTFSTLTGANAPTGALMIAPFLDRLFAIESDGVRSTDARDDTRWSPSTSTWATYKPAGSSGRPTALHVHSTTGQQGDPLAQLLIFQPAAVTALTGTDFGTDVTAASASTGWDAALTLLSASHGTQSPYSIKTAGGLGTFWVNQRRQVCWLPLGQSTPIIVSENIFSNRTDVYGLNNANLSKLNQIIAEYHDRFYKVYFPIINNDYPSIQYWLDLRQPNDLFNGIYKWYGPMVGQSPSRVWVEDQQGDPEDLMGLEGQTTKGVYLYYLSQENTWTDPVATDDNDVVVDQRTFYHGFGVDDFEKFMTVLEIDASGYLNNASVSANDLHGTQFQNASLVMADGTAFTHVSYGNNINYGTGYNYGAALGHNLGFVRPVSEGLSIGIGDRLQVITTHTTGRFEIHGIRPHVRARRQQPVT